MRGILTKYSGRAIIKVYNCHEKRERRTIQTDKKKLSWLDLDEEELLKLTDVSVCMYKEQDPNG